MLVGWMVMGFLVYADVCMGGFSIYSVSEGAVHRLVYVNIQKKEVSILYVVVNSI